GLIALHRATKAERWLTAAKQIADQMNRLFWDEAAGGYFQTAKDQSVVLTRIKPAQDTAIPSGNSMAALSLVRLARSTEESSYAERAAGTFVAFAGPLTQMPGRWPQMVRVLGEYLDAGYSQESLGKRPAAQEPQLVWAQPILAQKQIAAGR